MRKDYFIKMNYKEIIDNVVKNGQPKQATRYDSLGSVIPVENGTIGTFCEIFRHDMSTGFPLTTLRKMPWKSIRVELEGFIKGITSKKWFQERGCKFWNEWANPLVVQKEMEEIEEHLQERVEYHGDSDILKEGPSLKELQKEVDDLGPIYGYQWRNFGEHYGEWEFEDVGEPDTIGNYQQIDNRNGINKGFDQLLSIVEKLKTSPYDRRMVCSAWNPNQLHMAALPSCHWGFNIVVYGNKLNLIWHQRSCDLLLGVGANIASYGLLLMLLCEESGLEPGELVGTLADCHIYQNHMDAAHELIKRQEGELPQIKIKRKEDGSFSIFDWTFDEVELSNYNPQEKIDVGAVTV
jgi:thymidylate synthase